MQSTAQMTVGGREVTVRQETIYPWDGTITLRLGMDEPSMFGLRLRIPGWCRNAQLKVNGDAFDIASHLEQGYVRVERVWQADDRVELELAMPVERMYAHPNVRQDAGCVVLQRGPLVYFLEEDDTKVPMHSIIEPRHEEMAYPVDPAVLG